MLRNAGPLAAILIATLACAVGGTSVASTWRAPEVRQLAFHRAVTTFVSTDTAMRRAVEDRLATRIPGSFPAYSAAPELSLTDPAKAREQLRRKLFDGAVVARVVDIRTEKPNALGERWASAHPTFKGYWSSSWTLVRDPAYLTTSDGAMVEVLIYSLADDRLVWAGRAGSVKPQKLQGLVDHSVDAVVRQLWATQMLR
jgi:hypothetical protein